MEGGDATVGQRDLLERERENPRSMEGLTQNDRKQLARGHGEGGDGEVDGDVEGQRTHT